MASAAPPPSMAQLVDYISAAGWPGRRRWLTPLDNRGYPAEHLVYTYLPAGWDREQVRG